MGGTSSICHRDAQRLAQVFCRVKYPTRSSEHQDH